MRAFIAARTRSTRSLGPPVDAVREREANEAFRAFAEATNAVNTAPNATAFMISG